LEKAGAHSGTYRAWEMKGDDGAYQISTNLSYRFKIGHQIILTWWALGDTSSDPQGTNPTDPTQSSAFPYINYRPRKIHLM